MEGKASGGGYIPRGLLGKDGVHRGVFQSIVLGGGGGRRKGQEWLGQSNKVGSDARMRSWHATPRAIGSHGRI